MSSWKIAMRSEVGNSRATNQDRAVVVEAGACSVLAVCDGMGGHLGGEVASAHTAATLVEIVERAAPTDARSLARTLVAALEAANERVRAAAAVPHLHGMGTTATAAGVIGDALVLAQVGDSRAYLWRRGKLWQLTRDQTLAQMLVETGQLQPWEVATFEHGNVILQAVGTNAHVDVDLRGASLRRGDVVLVCSDGLHGVVAASAIEAALVLDPPRAVDRLVELALANGGPDNVTCVVARFDGAELREPSPESERTYGGSSYAPKL